MGACFVAHHMTTGALISYLAKSAQEAEDYQVSLQEQLEGELYALRLQRNEDVVREKREVKEIEKNHIGPN